MVYFGGESIGLGGVLDGERGMENGFSVACWRKCQIVEPLTPMTKPEGGHPEQERVKAHECANTGMSACTPGTLGG